MIWYGGIHFRPLDVYYAEVRNSMQRIVLHIDPLFTDPDQKVVLVSDFVNVTFTLPLLANQVRVRIKIGRGVIELKHTTFSTNCHV